MISIYGCECPKNITNIHPKQAIFNISWTLHPNIKPNFSFVHTIPSVPTVKIINFKFQYM